MADKNDQTMAQKDVPDERRWPYVFNKWSLGNKLGISGLNCGRIISRQRCTFQKNTCGRVPERYSLDIPGLARRDTVACFVYPKTHMKPETVNEEHFSKMWQKKCREEAAQKKCLR